VEDAASGALDSEVLRDSVTAPQRKGTLLLIKVTDPIKRDDSTSSLSVVGKKYVEYLVSTTATRAGSQVRHTPSPLSLLVCSSLPWSLARQDWAGLLPSTWLAVLIAQVDSTVDLLRDAPCAFPHWAVRVRACTGVRTQVAQWAVRRRFRDFVTLADVLSDSHRGYFIPQRPEKTLMEGQLSADKEFVEDRRVQLERYLNALAAHPVRPHPTALERTAKRCGSVGFRFVCWARLGPSRRAPSAARRVLRRRLLSRDRGVGS
jgi:hypothetical protein